MATTNYFDAPVSERYIGVVRDFLSHSVTGEIIGMRNFSMMVGLTDDFEEQHEFLEHALNEKGHAETYQKIGDELGLPLIVNTNAPYWKKIKDHFNRYIVQQDLTACIIVQEIMLESMAVGMYEEIGKAFGGKLGQIYIEIGAEEKSHLHHSVEELKEIYENDREGFIEKVKLVHDQVMVAIASMLTKVDHEGHCEICHGSCVKEDLGEVHLKLSDMRGAVMQNYLNILDEVGLPGDMTLKWVANLPM